MVDQGRRNLIKLIAAGTGAAFAGPVIKTAGKALSAEYAILQPTLLEQLIHGTEGPETSNAIYLPIVNAGQRLGRLRAFPSNTLGEETVKVDTELQLWLRSANHAHIVAYSEEIGLDAESDHRTARPLVGNTTVHDVIPNESLDSHQLVFKRLDNALVPRGATYIVPDREHPDFLSMNFMNVQDRGLEEVINNVAEQEQIYRLAESHKAGIAYDAMAATSGSPHTLDDYDILGATLKVDGQNTIAAIRPVVLTLVDDMVDTAHQQYLIEVYLDDQDHIAQPSLTALLDLQSTQQGKAVLEVVQDHGRYSKVKFGGVNPETGLFEELAGVDSGYQRTEVYMPHLAAIAYGMMGRELFPEKQRLIPRVGPHSLNGPLYS